MDDATFVRGFEGIGNLNCDFENLVAGKRLTGDEVLESFSGETLHHDEGVAFGLVNFVNRADVGMIESGSGAGFSLESFERLMVPHQLGREKLNRNIPAETKIHGAVHDSHAPAAEKFFDPIVRNDFANHRRTERKFLQVAMLGGSMEQVNATGRIHKLARRTGKQKQNLQ